MTTEYLINIIPYEYYTLSVLEACLYLHSLASYQATLLLLWSKRCRLWMIFALFLILQFWSSRTCRRLIVTYNNISVLKWHHQFCLSCFEGSQNPTYIFFLMCNWLPLWFLRRSQDIITNWSFTFLISETRLYVA